jgi:acyl-CoA dehydrogenase
MTLHAAWKMDTEGAAAARQEIALIKFYGARVLHDVVDRALQAHGALGYSTDLPLEQMYRFARAARVYDGPDEVHRQSVARQILRGYEAPAGDVPSEHLPTRRAAARERFAELLEAVTSND